MTKKINVSGVAVRAGLSLNGIIYTPEELAKFTPTLKDKPFLKDHHNATDNTIGLVTDSSFENSTTNVNYKGWIKDDGKGIIERITDGRIKEVSIGGVVGRLVKENLEDDFFIAKDMKAMELSTTPTPAVVGTSIKQTLKDLSEVTKPDDYKNVKPFSENVALINESYSNIINESKKVEDVKINIKVVAKFVCPICEINLSSIDDLRKHMKEHNEEQTEEPEKTKKKKENKNIKNNLEDLKMADELKVDTKEIEDKQKEIEAKEADLKKREGEVKGKEEAIAKEKRETLEKEYTAVAEEKKITPRDISKLSDETVSELTEQLKLVEAEEPAKEEPAKEEPAEKPAKEEPAKEEPEKKDETKGKVETESEEKEEALEGYKVEKSEFGSGFSLYQESYDKDKHPRLAR